jgi:hypothetical protein
MDAGVNRLLYHTTLDLNLYKLTHLKPKKQQGQERLDPELERQHKEKPNQWADTDSDHGASYYYIKARDAPHYLVPSDRLALAHFMAAKSVKMRYLITLLGDWVIREKEKVLVVAEYPMSQW